MKIEWLTDEYLPEGIRLKPGSEEQLLLISYFWTKIDILYDGFG